MVHHNLLDQVPEPNILVVSVFPHYNKAVVIIPIVCFEAALWISTQELISEDQRAWLYVNILDPPRESFVLFLFLVSSQNTG